MSSRKKAPKRPELYVTTVSNVLYIWYPDTGNIEYWSDYFKEWKMITASAPTTAEKSEYADFVSYL